MISTDWWRVARGVLAPVPFKGYRPTPLRLANLYLNRLENRDRRTPAQFE
jgi:hypothetical protein